MRASVIIPTFNRCSSLRDTLNALGRQTFPHQEFEVIVVDDGSTDDTRFVAVESFSYPFHYFRQPNQGAAAARNFGVHRSVGRLLIFLDDDMLPEPDYVRSLVAEHDQFPNVVGMGTILPRADGSDGLFSRCVQRSSSQRVTSESASFQDCTSNSLSVEREAFLRVGQWRDVCGDGQALWGDVELGYRAYRQGMRFRRSVGAICHHRDYAIRDLQTACARMRRVAQLAHALFRVYPELEAELPMFRDMSAPRWRVDRPSLVLRKLVRFLSATRPAVGIEERIVGILESSLPSEALLARLYRWVIGAYICRGYREGLQSCTS